MYQQPGAVAVENPRDDTRRVTDRNKLRSAATDWWRRRESGRRMVFRIVKSVVGTEGDHRPTVTVPRTSVVPCHITNWVRSPKQKEKIKYRKMQRGCDDDVERMMY
jgi:hypothetical protein